MARTKFDFCHLHAHDQYSQLDGVGQATEWAIQAKDLGFKYLATTNHGNVDGSIKYQKACNDIGIKAIIGCELYIVKNIHNKEKGEKRSHMLVLVKDQTGWQNLLQMLTVANVEGFYHRPRVDPKLVKKYCEGLVFTSACSSSFIHKDWGQKLFADLSDKIHGDLYLEICPHQMDLQLATNEMVQKMHKKFGIKILATNDCHYPTQEGSETQEVLLAIQSKAKWSDAKRWKFDINDLFMKTRVEMLDAFRSQKQLPESLCIDALQTSMEIAEKCCDFSIKQLPVHLPKVPGHEHEDEKEMMHRIIDKGLKDRIVKSTSKIPIEDYKERIKEEFELICELGFERYFLIVWELIDWCKKNDILSGPGRGSVGGSLVAYLMGITNVDPLIHNLIFSRFISPARIDLPDIDMDFEDIKRDQIRKHLEESYGSDNVAGVSTFLTMRGRSALRDVARVFEVPFNDVDAAAKSIVVRSQGDSRSNFSIEDAFKTFEDGIKFQKKYPKPSRISMDLEGQIRGSGQHAAGMCVSSDDLREGKRCNLCLRRGTAVVNWDKHDAEYMGMMKLDVLGLSALTILNETKRLVKAKYHVDIDYSTLSLEDDEVYAEISAGHTVGAFQIGSVGLSKYCSELGVSCFDDLVDATALWRPGTLRAGMTTEFQLRKHGKHWEPIHPALKELTKDTYGIILYQEQVMKFMYELGGLPWRTCDTVRKVISKSQGDELFLKFKQQFVDGCKRLGTLDEESASKVWSELSTFGCLTGDTVIYRASSNQYTGKELTIKDAFEYQFTDNFKHRGLNVLSMHSDGQVRFNKIKKVISTGLKSVFLLKTTSNKTIRATDNHIFLANNKWKQLKDIQEGDWIRCSDLKLAKNIYGKGLGSGPHGQSSPRSRKGEGKTNDQKKQRSKLHKLHSGRCQICGSKFCLEMHHINESHEDNSDDNTMLLCRKCHKRQNHSKTLVRFKKGYHTQNERIIEKKLIGRRYTFDIEMEDEPRNFIANNIVTHNSYGFNRSHSVEYSMITFWDMWCKIHYPTEFMAASLTYGQDDKKEDYIEECKRIGLTIQLPKIGTSSVYKWIPDSKQKKLFIPFIEIKGVGEVSAKKIEDLADRHNKTFFNKDREDKEVKKPNKTIMNHLDSMHAFDENRELTEDERDSINELFSFDISSDPMRKVRGIFDKLLEKGIISNLKDINYEKPSKEVKYYFGKVDEVKFGYRQNVLGKQKKSGGPVEMAGTAESMGGVYGFFKDESDSAMMVFGNEIYTKKKYEIEHCSDKWMLIKGSHPRQASTLFCQDVILEDELLECKFDPMEMDLLSDGKNVFDAKSLSDCTACPLIKDCDGPVHPTPGDYDIMIIGEAPGWEEDRDGIGFLGNSGDVLWSQLNLHGFERNLAYVKSISPSYKFLFNYSFILSMVTFFKSHKSL